MEKQQVTIAGYEVTRLGATAYEAANPKENLDFYFEADDPEEVKVFVFDSLIPTKNAEGKDPCLAVFYASSLEEAISDCMISNRDTLKGYEWFTA